MSSDVTSLQRQIDELSADNEALRRKLALHAPPADRLPGNRVVLVFFSLISLSMLLAGGLWVQGRKTAKARAARPAPQAAAGRVDQAGLALTRGLQRCASELPAGPEVDVRLEVRLVPAGTVGLIDAAIKPDVEKFALCVRAIPAEIKIDPEAGNASPKLEFRYLIERPQEASYQARWSWRLLP